MTLRLVISGGQTGADRTGLECARRFGLATGGTVPKGWRTDEGPDPTLRAFGCVESRSASYPPRTRANVKAADVTLWFGDARSPGGRLTRRLCKEYGRPFVENPTDLRALADRYAVWNVAGNKRRTNPGVVAQVEAAFATLFGKE